MIKIKKNHGAEHSPAWPDWTFESVDKKENIVNRKEVAYYTL